MFGLRVEFSLRKDWSGYAEVRYPEEPGRPPDRVTLDLAAGPGYVGTLLQILPGTRFEIRLTRAGAGIAYDSAVWVIDPAFLSLRTTGGAVIPGSGKYERDENPLTLEAGEPVFVVRAKDVMMGSTLRHYRRGLAELNLKTGVDAIRDRERAVDEWQAAHPSKLPD